jgi:K+-transporting ATPase ATPase C chain
MNQLRPALVALLFLTLLTGFAYPGVVTGVAQVLFPAQSGGSLIERDGKVVGSSLIGQNFTSDQYFQGRPSATSGTDPEDDTKTVPVPYNAANTAASNAGPLSQSLIDRVREDAEKRQAENPGVAVPVDLVTTTGSGLDPHITPAAALFQVPRVARARGIAEAELRQIVQDRIEGRLFGIIGEPRVNVLALNLALDAPVTR